MKVQASIKNLSPIEVDWPHRVQYSEISAMKNYLSKQVIRISGSSAGCLPDRPMKRLLPDSHYADSSKTAHGKGGSVISRMNKLGTKMDNFAQGIRDHIRLAPKLSETVKGKLSFGARILQVGGVEKVFKQLFSVRDGEKLMKASQCYLSTTTGPIAGVIFISTDKVAFCSERPIKLVSSTGKLIRIYYKVTIPLRKIQQANTSVNVKKPSQKYMEVVTSDNFEFWFMGLLNQQKTLKCLQQVISDLKLID